MHILTGESQGHIPCNLTINCNFPISDNYKCIDSGPWKLGVPQHPWNCQLIARRALSLFNDVPLRTRRALSLYDVYGDSTLLVLNGILLNSISALLALHWWNMLGVLQKGLPLSNRIEPYTASLLVIFFFFFFFFLTATQVKISFPKAYFD